MLITHGTTTVAEWLGVTPPAVSNWLARYPTDAVVWWGYPQPDVVIVSGDRRPRYGWLATRKADWVRWYQDRDLTASVPPTTVKATHNTERESQER